MSPAPPPRAPVGFGERVPDFVRHRADGTAQHFYDLFDGGPLLLLACASRDPEPLRRALRALDQAGGAARRVMLVPLPPPALADLGVGGSLVELLADDGAVTGYLLGPRAAAGSAVVLALDGNQRVLARIDVTEPEGVGAALRVAEASLASPEWSTPGVISSGAPALFVPRVFEPELCAELIAIFEREGGRPSGVIEDVSGKAVLKVNPTYKMRRDFQSFDASWTSRLSSILLRRVAPEMDKCFAYRPTTFEALKVVRYDASDGGYHHPHRDNVTPDVQDRRFAMSVNLNAGEYRGGQLRFPEYGPQLYQPPTGGGVVFSSSMLHEALAVTEGSRYVFLTFLSDDRDRGPHLYHAPR